MFNSVIPSRRMAERRDDDNPTLTRENRAMMQPEVYYGEYYSVETTAGTEIIPVDVSGKVRYLSDLEQYCEGRLIQPYSGPPSPRPSWLDSLPDPINGWLARLTMPGYLDSTAWGAYDSEEEARAALDDMYGGTDGRYYI